MSNPFRQLFSWMDIVAGKTDTIIAFLVLKEHEKKNVFNCNYKKYHKEKNKV